MDKRTRQLSIAFGSLIVCALVYKVVYPTWIEPLTTLEERTAVARRELDKLEEYEAEVRQAKDDYRDLVERIASFDATEIQNALGVKLNDLIKKHKFQDADTSRRRGKPDRKNKIVKSSITVKGRTDLASAIGFLRDIAELPELIRVGKPSMSPVRSSSRKGPQKGPQLVNLTVPIEYWVLPQDKYIGRLDKADLIQPVRVVRHDGRNYSLISKRNPLTEVIPAPPLKLSMGRAVVVKPRGRGAASGSASGGTPPYTYSWEPSDAVDKPSISRPYITATEPGEFELTLRVTDAEGVEASGTLKVTIRGPKKPPKPPGEGDVVDSGDKPPPPWRDRKYMQLAMTLSRTEGDRRISEVMIHNIKNKKTDYYTVGDDFNGGELIYIHSRGGLVFRGGKYFVHPIGDRLDTELDINDAGEYPRFQLAAQKHGKLMESLPKDAAEAGGDKKPVAQKKPGPKKSRSGGKAKQPAGKNAKKAATIKAPSAKKKVSPPIKDGAGKSGGSKKPGAVKPATKKSAAKMPGAERPARKRSAAKKPAAKKPGAKKPAKAVTPAAGEKKKSPAKSGKQETSPK